MYKVVARRSISSDYTITSDDKIISVNTSGGDVTIELPQISDVGSIFECDIIHSTAGNILIIDPSGGDKINNNQENVVSNIAGDSFKIRSIETGLWEITQNISYNYYRDRLAFNSNLDTTTAPILMIGGVGFYQMTVESKLDNDETSFQVRLDSSDNWVDVSIGVDLDDTITNFLSWVDTNVTEGVQWEYRVNVTYDSGEDGESSIVVDYRLN